MPEDRVTEEKQEGMYLVLAPELPNCVSVNVVGKEIIDLCDGKRTVREITEILSRKRGEDPEENVRGVLAFFNYLEEKQFAFHAPVRVEPFKARTPEKLLALWVNVTCTCNLRCRHCHSAFGAPLENELTTEELIHLMRESSRFSDCSLVISGGEPFCREDISQVLRAASDSFGGKVSVITNGVLLNDEDVEMLREIKMSVQVSLEGPDAASNDSIRGRGVFEKAVKTVRKLKAAGVQTVVRMTILKTNMDKVEDIIAFSRREGVGAVTLGTLQRSGRAYEAIEEIDPTTEDLIETYRTIRALDPDFTYINFNESMRPGINRMERMDLCGAGSEMLSIGADGGVYPCAGMMYPSFLAGNVRASPLEEIWKTSPVLEKLRNLSVSKIPGCSTCAVRYVCGGGCMVDIFWEHGHLQGKTPRCGLMHAMKWDELKQTVYKTRSMG